MCQSSSAPVSESARDRADGEAAHDVGGEHHPAAIEAVADHAAEQQEDDRRHGHRDADDGQRGRRVRERVDLPRHRDQEDAVAEQRDAHAAPQQAEVAVAQRDEQADAAEAAGPVEPFVAMVHRPGWARPDTGPEAASRRYSSVASASIGRAKRKPWPRSQPSSRRPIHCSWSSMPSATTSSWSVSPSATTALARAELCGDAPRRRNERSILRMSTGRRLR